MPSVSLSMVLQVVVGLGLLNVWLLRAGSKTPYRGGRSRTLREEFREYGLPEPTFQVVGALKIVAGIALIAGIWVSALVLPAAVVVAVLMVGALAMHARVKDPAIRYLPAFLMLAMSVSLCYLVTS